MTETLSLFNLSSMGVPIPRPSRGVSTPSPPLSTRDNISPPFLFLSSTWGQDYEMFVRRFMLSKGVKGTLAPLYYHDNHPLRRGVKQHHTYSVASPHPAFFSLQSFINRLNLTRFYRDNEIRRVQSGEHNLGVGGKTKDKKEDAYADGKSINTVTTVPSAYANAPAGMPTRYDRNLADLTAALITGRSV